MRKTIATCGVGVAALSAAACGTTRTVDLAESVPHPAVVVSVPGPTVTVTTTTTAQSIVDVTESVPGPTVSVTVSVPGPTETVTTTKTETVTTTKTAQPSVLMTRTFNGSGDWNSPEFALGCASPAVQVRYSYSGNAIGGKADNFIADVESPSGDVQIVVNTIASSGGTTTTVYPDVQLNGSDRYYLGVQASGDWSFTLRETCG